MSFGIAKIISDHPSYNYGLALPFVIAFYLLNSDKIYSLSWIDYSFGVEGSALIKMLAVTVYYFTFIMFLLMSSSISSLVKSSKLHLVWPVVTVVGSVLAFVFQDGNPMFGLVFGASAFLYLIFARFDAGELSVWLVQLTFGMFSVFCFVVGILWLNGDYVFSGIISALFGFDRVVPGSVKIGAFMLVVLGYSVFYSVFKVGEFWRCS